MLRDFRPCGAAYQGGVHVAGASSWTFVDAFESGGLAHWTDDVGAGP